MGIMIRRSSVFEMKGGCPHRACPERAKGLTPPAARLRVCSAEGGRCRLGLSILLLLIMMAVNAVRESRESVWPWQKRQHYVNESSNKASSPTWEITPVVPPAVWGHLPGTPHARAAWHVDLASK